MLSFLDSAVSQCPVVLTTLRDDRVFIGIVRAYDQFGNVVLSSATERIFSPNRPQQYATVYFGTVLLRGESLELIGEITDHEAQLYLSSLNELAQPIAPTDHPSKNSTASNQTTTTTTEVTLQQALQSIDDYNSSMAQARLIYGEYKSRLARLNENETLQDRFIRDLLSGEPQKENVDRPVRSSQPSLPPPPGFSSPERNTSRPPAVVEYSNYIHTVQQAINHLHNHESSSSYIAYTAQ